MRNDDGRPFVIGAILAGMAGAYVGLTTGSRLKTGEHMALRWDHPEIVVFLPKLESSFRAYLIHEESGAVAALSFPPLYEPILEGPWDWRTLESLSGSYRKNNGRLVAKRKGSVLDIYGSLVHMGNATQRHTSEDLPKHLIPWILRENRGPALSAEARRKVEDAFYAAADRMVRQVPRFEHLNLGSAARGSPLKTVQPKDPTAGRKLPEWASLWDMTARTSTDKVYKGEEINGRRLSWALVDRRKVPQGFQVLFLSEYGDLINDQFLSDREFKELEESVRFVERPTKKVSVTRKSLLGLQEKPDKMHRKAREVLFQFVDAIDSGGPDEDSDFPMWAR